MVHRLSFFVGAMFTIISCGCQSIRFESDFYRIETLLGVYDYRGMLVDEFEHVMGITKAPTHELYNDTILYGRRCYHFDGYALELEYRKPYLKKDRLRVGPTKPMIYMDGLTPEARMKNYVSRLPKYVPTQRDGDLAEKKASAEAESEF
jgi:hypothetical protein